MTNNEVRFLVTLGIDAKDLKLKADAALKEYKNHTVNFTANTTELKNKLDVLLKKYTESPQSVSLILDETKSKGIINFLAKLDNLNKNVFFKIDKASSDTITAKIKELKEKITVNADIKINNGAIEGAQSGNFGHVNLIGKLNVAETKRVISEQITKMKLPKFNIGATVNVTPTVKPTQQAQQTPAPTPKLYNGTEAQVIQQVRKEYEKLGQEVHALSGKSAQAEREFIESLKRKGNQVQIDRNAQTGAITKITTTYRNSANEIQRTFFTPIEARYDKLNATVKTGMHSVQGFVAAHEKIKNTETYDLDKGIRKFSEALDTARHKSHITGEQYDKLKAKLQNVTSANQLDAMNQKLDRTVATETRRIELIEKQNRLKQIQSKMESDLARLQNMHPRYVIKHEEAIKRLRQEIQAFGNNKLLNAGSGEILKYDKGQFSDLQRLLETSRNSVNRLGADAADAMRNSMGLIENLRIAAQRFPVWMLSSTIFYQTARGIKDLTDKVIELDTALTNMRRVMDLPEHKFNEMLKQSINDVTELSGKLDGFLELVSDFGRMGFNDVESLDLSNTAQMLSNISELKPNESISSLVGAMINFNIAAKDSVQIADKLNEVNITAS